MVVKAPVVEYALPLLLLESSGGVYCDGPARRLVAVEEVGGDEAGEDEAE